MKRLHESMAAEVYRFISIGFIFAVLACQTGWASSGWGHYGQSIYLFAVEMPSNPIIYKSILGDELFAQLTNEVSSGSYQFSLENLNKCQEAFAEGSIAPDIFDVKYFLCIGAPIHSKYPQRMLDYINDMTSREKNREDYLIGRAFFFGWAFHYIADLVVHPAMNKGNKFRESREYAKHAPQHGIYEGLTDRIALTYWFLKNREKGIYPSKVIEKAGGAKAVLSLIREIPNHWNMMMAETKAGAQVLGKIFKGIFSKDKVQLQANIREGKEQIRFLKESLFDKSLKKFFERGIPEEEIMSGKMRLRDYFGEEWDRPPSAPVDGIDYRVVKSDVSEGIYWWKLIMKNTPDGFRFALAKKGFACSLDYGNSVPTPEPELPDKALRAIHKIYDSVMGR